MINEEVARILEHMARLLTFKSKDRFRARGLRKSGGVHSGREEDLATISEQGKLKDIPRIGKDLSEMIDEYITTRT